MFYPTWVLLVLPFTPPKNVASWMMNYSSMGRTSRINRCPRYEERAHVVIASATGDTPMHKHGNYKEAAKEAMKLLPREENNKFNCQASLFAFVSTRRASYMGPSWADELHTVWEGAGGEWRNPGPRE